MLEIDHGCDECGKSESSFNRRAITCLCGDCLSKLEEKAVEEAVDKTVDEAVSQALNK